MTRELTASVGRQNISLRDGAAALFRRKGLVLLTFLTVIIGTVIVTLVPWDSKAVVQKGPYVAALDHAAAVDASPAETRHIVDEVVHRNEDGLVTADEHGDNYEIGGDYELELGPGKLKLIGVGRGSRFPNETNVITRFSDNSSAEHDRFTQIERDLQDPDMGSQPDTLRKLGKEHSDLKPMVEAMIRNRVAVKVNVEKVAKLRETGKMRPPGEAAFARRRDDRTGVYSFERGEDPVLDPDQEKRFRANAGAWEFFQSQPPWYRRTAIWRVVSAKKEETRKSRLAKLIEDAAQGRMPKALTPPG